ncbi:MAG: hypothetical protein GF334_02790 [Candidatus Altiarchaeales archaeon]|nr:hypothetical protein [Candidatus Altiarchaeales archaeon]
MDKEDRGSLFSYFMSRLTMPGVKENANSGPYNVGLSAGEKPRFWVGFFSGRLSPASFQSAFTGLVKREFFAAVENFLLKHTSEYRKERPGEKPVNVQQDEGGNTMTPEESLQRHVKDAPRDVVEARGLPFWEKAAAVIGREKPSAIKQLKLWAEDSRSHALSNSEHHKNLFSRYLEYIAKKRLKGVSNRLAIIKKVQKLTQHKRDRLTGKPDPGFAWIKMDPKKLLYPLLKSGASFDKAYEKYARKDPKNFRYPDVARIVYRLKFGEYPDRGHRHDTTTTRLVQKTPKGPASPGVRIPGGIYEGDTEWKTGDPRLKLRPGIKPGLSSMVRQRQSPGGRVPYGGQGTSFSRRRFPGGFGGTGSGFGGGGRFASRWASEAGRNLRSRILRFANENRDYMPVLMPILMEAFSKEASIQKRAMSQREYVSEGAEAFVEALGKLKGDMLAEYQNPSLWRQRKRIGEKIFTVIARAAFSEPYPDRENLKPLAKRLMGPFFKGMRRGDLSKAIEFTLAKAEGSTPDEYGYLS